MRALFMGGTEFIGLHLLQSLLRRGHDVTVFNRGTHPERLPASVRTIVGDRKDHVGLRERLKGQRFDGVFDVTYAPTLGPDVDALAAALDGQPHVIFVSTGRVYDHTLPIPYSEETPRGFFWGDYARHKIAGEDALLTRYRATGLPVTIVRPTHVMGPLNTRHNEAFFMDRIWRGRPVLIPGDGGWLRQFGHVEDLADAMAAMLGDSRAYGQAYDVMGRSVTPRYFDPALLKSLDKPGPVFGQNLVYECHAVHTTHKLRRELGVRPRYSLASALAHTWEWYKREGLADRPVDLAFEDTILAKIGA